MLYYQLIYYSINLERIHKPHPDDKESVHCLSFDSSTISDGIGQTSKFRNDLGEIVQGIVLASAMKASPPERRGGRLRMVFQKSATQKSCAIVVTVSFCARNTTSSRALEKQHDAIVNTGQALSHEGSVESTSSS